MRWRTKKWGCMAENGGIHEESTMPAITNTPAELRAHITPDPDVPPPPPEKEPPPDNTPLPEEPPIEEPTPKQPPMKV